MHEKVRSVMTDDTSQLQEKILHHGVLPRHIAIIMDGNGRWAKARSLPRVAGHNEGINSVREVVRTCGDLGIEVLTLYTFSVENWNRPANEVSALMSLLLDTIREEVEELQKNNVKLQVLGDLNEIPEEPRKGMLEAIERTHANTGLILNLALNYGGRQEILEAVEKLYRDVESGKHSIADLKEELFSGYLYTAHLPDPDLLIRTSGESRISNFLLWQIAYTELYITATYWPDFREKELYQAILDYQCRERRFGKVSEQVNNHQSILLEQS